MPIPIESPAAPLTEKTRDPYACWTRLHEGFAPLYCASVVREAFGWLAPVLGPGRRALDLGCGSGHAGGALAVAGASVVGVDVDAPLLRRARSEHPGRALVAGRAESLPLDDASVDAVFCFSVFQYVPRERAIAELARVLKPGGRFAVVENLRDNPVAIAYRAARAVRRTPYYSAFAPLRHPGWRERHAYARHFPGARLSARHLFTPALLASRAIASAPADVAPDSWAARSLRWAEAIDRFLLRRVPGAAAAAWLLLATGEKP